MKKFSKRIIEIVFILILSYQQFSYADIIIEEIRHDPVANFRPIAFLIGFIGVIVLLISAISFFCLKGTVKKQNISEYDCENFKDIEKKKDTIQRRFYLWGMILAIIGLIYSKKNGEISNITFFIPIILFIISVITRLCKKKKISNIICGITVVLVCIIVLWNVILNKNIENYNAQFTSYIEDEKSYISRNRYISDVEGLLNTAINNNKSGRKTTIIYQSTNYTSEDELKQLLSKIDTNKRYIISITYDKSYDYIECIKLTSYDK